MRILALDVGKRRIGIAVSDPLGITARPHSTILRNREAHKTIAALTRELEAGKILIGLPLHLSGVEGEQARDARTFGKELEALVYPLPVEYHDERLTTVEAKELLNSGRKKAKSKEEIDAVAAALILQTYLREK